MHRITSKKQHLSQTGVQFDGTLNAGYEPVSYTHLMGGYLTTLAKEWQSVREEISTEWLKEGKNTILFTLPSDASYSCLLYTSRVPSR